MYAICVVVAAYDHIYMVFVWQRNYAIWGLSFVILIIDLVI